MATALQQQVFALDVKYNTSRVPSNTNFRSLYIRRRNQLIRETYHDNDIWREYLRLRTILLQQKYDNRNKPSTIQIPKKLPTPEECQIDRRSSVKDAHAFSSVFHIFDQHTDAVTMVKFAKHHLSQFACSSTDGTLSICHVSEDSDSSASVRTILRGHTKPVTDFDWSANNDLIVSTSLDGTGRVWHTSKTTCLRIIQTEGATLLCCLFHPANSNLFVVGTDDGQLKIANCSTGLFVKNRFRVPGRVLTLTSDGTGTIFWLGTDQGQIFSVACATNGTLGKKTRRLSLLTSGTNISISSIAFKTKWQSSDCCNPLLLVNATNNTLYVFNVLDSGLVLRKKVPNRHLRHLVRSIFCTSAHADHPSCVVTGSEDGSIYFVDVDKFGPNVIVQTLQGHACPVLSLAYNDNETFLVSSDVQGLVIVWKNHSKTCNSTINMNL